MALIYLQMEAGFMCGDTVTRRTAFAYATSTHATHAKRNPKKVAAEMMKQENAFQIPDYARNAEKQDKDRMREMECNLLSVTF